MDRERIALILTWGLILTLVILGVQTRRAYASPLKLERQSSLFRGDLITPDRIRPCLDCGPNQTARTLELDDKVNIKARWTIRF